MLNLAAGSGHLPVPTVLAVVKMVRFVGLALTIATPQDVVANRAQIALPDLNSYVALSTASPLTPYAAIVSVTRKHFVRQVKHVKPMVHVVTLLHHQIQHQQIQQTMLWKNR